MALTQATTDVINISDISTALAIDSTLTGIKAYVDIADNLKAPLASPNLTGIPTTPTASLGTNTTQIATTAFVTAADNLKASLASPAFTGVPTAPTASVGTSTTQLATTAFVTTFQAGILYNVALITSSGNWTVPAGVTKIKVTLTGAGAGGSYATGGAGHAGGATSFGGYCSATGGGPSALTGNFSAGASGSGSGGDINITPPNVGGGGILGGYGRGGYGWCALWPGGPGGIAIKTISDLVSGTTISCTIGVGGAGYSAITSGPGASGAIIIEY
jgi:hypothetical protein